MKATEANTLAYKMNKENREKYLKAIIGGIEKRATEGKFTHLFHINEQLSPDVIRDLKKLSYDVTYTEGSRYAYIISWY